MKRCVIIGGADIKNYNYIKSCLDKKDFLIYCDSGLKHLDNLNLKPNLIVGDFDSYKNPNLDIETIVLPCEKDDTDTIYAVKEGVKRGFNEFLLIGVIGARLDHTLANVCILNFLNCLRKKAVIIDDYSEMEIVDNIEVEVTKDFSYFSLLNIFGKAKGISIKNAKYSLKNAKITTDYQYAISNEVIKGQTATIKVKKGKLLLVKVF